MGFLIKNRSRGDDILIRNTEFVFGFEKLRGIYFDPRSNQSPSKPLVQLVSPGKQTVQVVVAQGGWWEERGRTRG